MLQALSIRVHGHGPTRARAHARARPRTRTPMHAHPHAHARTRTVSIPGDAGGPLGCPSAGTQQSCRQMKPCMGIRSLQMENRLSLSPQDPAVVGSKPHTAAEIMEVVEVSPPRRRLVAAAMAPWRGCTVSFLLEAPGRSRPTPECAHSA